MSDTLIYVGESHRLGRDIHVLAYQNIAINESSTPNAMIIPFPTSQTMTEENIINTTTFKNFLKDISNATKSTRRLTLGGPVCATLPTCQAKVFDIGSYTVVLASHVKYVPEALLKVPKHKRPDIPIRFLFQYGKLYGHKPIAVCCWDGQIEAEPLLWWYEPINNKSLFIPTMDAHDGNPPNIDAIVKMDHIISAGSSNVPNGISVKYTDSIPEKIAEILPTKVHGTKMDYQIKNGDSFIDLDLVRNKRYGAHITRGINLENSYKVDSMYGWS